jgi:hypothetical protein
MVQRRRGGALSATAIVLAGLASSAHAAVGTPIDLGQGDKPNVTVEANGTADIAFTGRGSNSKELDYCRLPLDATACSVRSTIPAPGDSLSIPLAIGNGNTVQVVSYRYGLSGPSFSQVMVFTSTDGGNTWDGGSAIGAVAPNDWAFGPGGTISAVTSADQCGLCYQSMSLTGGSTGPAVLSADHPYVGTVAMVDPNTPLAVFADASGNGQFRRYAGSGDVNNAANWTPATDIGTLDYPRLVSGPTGVVMIAQQALSGSTMQARKYNGTTFGPPVTITTGTRADHAAEDGTGRVHVVGGRFTATGSGAALFYATSDDGTSWQTQDAPFPGVPGGMRVAVASDHFGIVTGTYETSTANGDVFAAAIGPSAAVPSTTKFAAASLVSGTVLIQAPPSKAFVPLQRGDVIPIGSIVDTTKGRVTITIALPNGTLQSTDFYQGLFKLTQGKTGLATMVLLGGNFRVCGRSAAVHSAKVKVIRQLWGAGSGKFRTKGKYASASIRGTTWDTIDRCDGTLIKVTKGRVQVTDFKKHRTVIVKAGHSYLAKA